PGSRRILVTSVLSDTSKGGSTTESRIVRPAESLASTTISRRSNGFSSTQSTAAYGAASVVPTTVPSTKKLTAESVWPGGMWIWATIRTLVTTPVRPSGEAILIEGVDGSR